MSINNKLVAVVSGSSRGIGRGIARVLGARGATVYVTGRSVTSGSQVSHGGAVLPGSIHEVAAEVTELGGKGVAVAVDPLVLLPGWPQTWWEYHKVMPELAKHFHVIAVDTRKSVILMTKMNEHGAGPDLSGGG